MKHPTIEQHEAMGAKIKELISEVTHLSVELANHYPVSQAVGMRMLDRAKQELSDLKWTLHGRMTREFPGEPDETFVGAYLAPVK